MVEAVLGSKTAKVIEKNYLSQTVLWKGESMICHVMWKKIISSA